MESTHEVREVAEADLDRDVGDRPGVVVEQTRRVAQPRADQILVWCHTEDFGEQSQEMKWAQARLRCGVFQRDGLVRVSVDPECGCNRSAAIVHR